MKLGQGGICFAVLSALAFFAAFTPAASNAENWATSTSFSNPTGVAVEYGGGIFIADTGNHRVQKVQVGPDTEPADNGGGNNNGAGGNSGGRNSNAGVKISKVKLIPNRGWIYRDGFLNMQVQVKNNGRNMARRIDLFLTSSKKKVKVPRRLRFGQILPGWTKTKTFKVKARRSARGWVMIEAQAWGKRNRSYLKLIKPWWPA